MVEMCTTRLFFITKYWEGQKLCPPLSKHVPHPPLNSVPDYGRQHLVVTNPPINRNNLSP